MGEYTLEFIWGSARRGAALPLQLSARSPEAAELQAAILFAACAEQPLPVGYRLRDRKGVVFSSFPPTQARPNPRDLAKSPVARSAARARATWAARNAVAPAETRSVNQWREQEELAAAMAAEATSPPEREAIRSIRAIYRLLADGAA